MIGQTLDRYRIESKLGEGGMGVVYKARDTQLDRDVAIKVLPPAKVSDPDRKQRFVQEAKAASALNHPNIITVYDIRAAGGVDFIVMEYVPGRTLDQIIPSKGLSVSQALRYGVPIADALARAHEAGIVHRDLKPSNVIVSDDGRVKVLDFGVAKLLDAPDAAAEAMTQTTPLTGVGTVVGTSAYMSPEQAQGLKVDGRSDIFSFGAVLYEMITGRRTFAGDSNVTVRAKIVKDDPDPPSRFATSLPADVERTILRCLRKDPARRFQTMADLKVALEDLATDSAAVPALPQHASRRGARWMMVPAVIVGIAAAYLAVRLIRAPSQTNAPLHAVPLTTVPGVVRSPTFSPDGNQVAFIWSGPAQDNRDVYVQQIGAGVPLRLTTDPAADHNPVWSPDGRAIAFLRPASDPRREELRLVPPLGGPERRIADIRPRGFLRAVSLSWCPDSTCIVVTDTQDESKPDALFVVSIETGEKRQLTSSQGFHFADTDPAVSPDGRWLVFRRDVSPFSGALHLLQLDDHLRAAGQPRSMTPILLGAYAPQWISNNEFVFAAKGALWRMSTSDGSQPARLPYVGEDGITPAVSARAARLVYVRTFQDSNTWRIDLSAPGVAASAPARSGISSTRRDELPQFSPDGRKVTLMSGRSGEWEVWVADASGANAIQLTSLGAVPGYPRWSHDGTMIAFHSNSAEQFTGDVFVVSADGGKPRNVTAYRDATDTFPSFSHDGQWIYFSSTRSGMPAIWKIAVSGGEAVPVLRATPSISHGQLLAIESSDGAYLYFVDSPRTASPGPLWRLPLTGGEPVKLADEVIATAFDVVDTGIYYQARTAAETAIRYFDFATHRSTVVAANLGDVGDGLAASRDGHTILFTKVDSSVDDLMLVENFR